MRYLLTIWLAFLSTALFSQEGMWLDSLSLRYMTYLSEKRLAEGSKGLFTLQSLVNDLQSRRTDPLARDLYVAASLELSVLLYNETLYESAYQQLKELRDFSMDEFDKAECRPLFLECAIQTASHRLTAFDARSFETIQDILCDIEKMPESIEYKNDIEYLKSNSYYSEGVRLGKAGEYKNAIENIEIALPYFESRDIEELSYAKFNLSMLLHNDYQYQKSFDYGFQAYTEMCRIGKSVSSAELLFYLMQTAIDFANEEYITKVNVEIDKLYHDGEQNPEMYFWLNSAKGNCSFLLHADNEMAMRWFLRNETFVEQQGESCKPTLAIHHYADIASVYANIGDSENCIQSLTKLLNLLNAEPADQVDMNRLVMCLSSLSFLHRESGCFDLSDYYTQQADSLCTQNPTLWNSFWMSQLAHLFPITVKTYEDKKSVNAKLESVIKIGCKCLEQIQDSEYQSHRFQILQTLQLFGFFVGREDVVMKVYPELKQMVQTRCKSPSFALVQAHLLLGAAEAFKGDMTEAKRDLQQCIIGMRTLLRKASIYYNENNKLKLIENLTGILPLIYYVIDVVDDNKKNVKGSENFALEIGLDTSILIKSYLLNSTLTLWRFLEKKGTPEDLELYRRIQAEYARSMSQRDDEVRFESETSIARWEDVLLMRAASSGLESSTHNMDFQWIKQNLNENEYLLDFAAVQTLLRGNQYVMYFVDTSMPYPMLFPLFSEAGLEEAKVITAEQFYDSSSMNRLLELVWSPIQPFVKPGSTIYYIPTHRFFQIDPSSWVMSDGSLLGDHYNFVRLSSVSQLTARKHTLRFGEKEGDRAVLIGGLNYDMTDEERMAEIMMPERKYDYRRGIRGNSTLKSLPETEKEAKHIEAILRKEGGEVELWTGTSGTAESFFSLDKNAPRLLHIATHGFYFLPSEAKEQPFFSGLQNAMALSGLTFAGANAAWTGKTYPDGVHSGIVTAADISVMDLTGLELVVLSACQTGEGSTSGEGIYGLQRAFKMAGAETLILSLWPVSDKITRLFMESFYANLTSPQFKGDKYRAFQSTKRQIRSQYPDPYYWAAFVMID